MMITDFEYDGITLSEMGYMLCQFDNRPSSTIDNGSVLDYGTVPVQYGTKEELTNVSYKDCLTATYQICKMNCNGLDDFEISFREFRELMAWLNRKEFHKFKLIDPDYLDVYYEASFNLSRIEMQGKIVGAELKCTTNRPFAVKEPQIIEWDATANAAYTIEDNSDEEGYIYPKLEVTVQSAGELVISNDRESTVCKVKNCTSGEKLTFDYPVITSSAASHKLAEDFNWTFPRLILAYRNRINNLSMSLPCSVKLTYSPIVKMGI